MSTDPADLSLVRVCVAEASKRRQSPHKCQRAYAFQLLEMAACARLRYMADALIARRLVMQAELFEMGDTHG